MQLTALLLGLAGTALVILQAVFWIPKGHANLAALILTAVVPLIAAAAFALTPRHFAQEQAQVYPVRSPIVWITLALPVLITLAAMILVGEGGNFDNFAGLALLLAANTGRNLHAWVQALLLRRSISGAA